MNKSAKIILLALVNVQVITCFGQYVPRQRLALGVYPLNIRTEGADAFYMANLSYDYRLKNTERGLTVGAFATYVRSGDPKVSETVLGPRVSYSYQEKRMTLFFGGGVGYGWRTGLPGTETSNVRLKYNVGASYRVLGPVGLQLELSNYRSQTPTKFGFWPMLGVNAQF